MPRNTSEESMENLLILYLLLWQDNTKMLVDLSASQQNFQKYLVGNIMNHIQTIRSCPVSKMKLCVTSQAEFSKCLKMRVSICCVFRERIHDFSGYYLFFFFFIEINYLCCNRMLCSDDLPGSVNKQNHWLWFQCFHYSLPVDKITSYSYSVFVWRMST